MQNSEETIYKKVNRKFRSLAKCSEKRQEEKNYPGCCIKKKKKIPKTF